MKILYRSILAALMVAIVALTIPVTAAAKPQSKHLANIAVTHTNVTREYHIATVAPPVTTTTVAPAPVVTTTPVTTTTLPTPVISAPVVAAPVVPTSPESNSAIWDCIIAHESGGNPAAVNPSSGAGGLFQFLPSSWIAYGGGQYAPLPEEASASAQWSVAETAQSQSGWYPWVGDGCTPVG